MTVQLFEQLHTTVILDKGWYWSWSRATKSRFKSSYLRKGPFPDMKAALFNLCQSLRYYAEDIPKHPIGNIEVEDEDEPDEDDI